MALRREYYQSSIKEFLTADKDAIFGKLCKNDKFEKITSSQEDAWLGEIEILKEQLQGNEDGGILFEYDIPRMGHRIDVVYIAQGIIFLLEFKVGAEEHLTTTDDQVMDYALDLKYFHEMSQDRYIVPISVSTEAPPDQIDITFSSGDKVADVLRCNKNTIGSCIQSVLSKYNDRPLEIQEWSTSRYAPTPTIIEAAQFLYRNHPVKEISRNDAGAQNLTQTTSMINSIIDLCKTEHKKAICFVTGVPGAGKTLAGLNIANERHQFETEEHAVFLSGNKPLVDVLQEALANDESERGGIKKGEASRQAKAFIQLFHKFRDDVISSDDPPIEKVIIFDEAQRAWDEKKLSDHVGDKLDFHYSEPDFLISVMDSHPDWAVVVCLVGGGQEINSGETGMDAWFQALNDKYGDWNIYLSDKMSDSEYVGNSSIQKLLSNRQYTIIPSLHLGVSLRSFRSERLSAFVKALLDNEAKSASEIYKDLSQLYPIVLTRNLDKAKSWVKTKSRGNERYGLLASSKGRRLRAVGIWVPKDINHTGWFLNEKGNPDSSYSFEVAASEFKVQGLEIDYSIVAWDADFRYTQGEFNYFNYSGQWQRVHIEQKQKYLKNAYRVLLTRARQGMVIFVPKGDPEDDTRRAEYYDGTYQYLKRIGVEEI